MKLLKSSIGLVLTLLCFSAAAQVPMKFNYQAVARNANGTAMTSQSIAVRIILTNGPGGTAQYTEHHNVTTNPFGVFSLQVGSGTVDAGSMNAVSWSLGNVWIKVELDATSGSNYITMGFAQLLSVPYAMVSGSSLSGGGSGAQTLDDLTDVTSTTPTNGQVLSYNGTQWIPTTLSLTNTDNQTLTVSGNMLSISGGNSVTLPTSTAQTLALNGNVLSISGGNSVTIPTTGGGSYTGGTGISISGSTINNTGDVSNTNEIQTLSLSGSTLSLSSANTITLPTSTDNQTLTVTGNTLAITGGNTVTLPAGSTYTAGSGIGISGTTISATDNSITNEIQTISLSGSTISLSNGGGSVVIPSSGGAQTLNDLTDVNTAGVQTGHVLKYDGTNWTPAPDNTTGTGGSDLWLSSGNDIYNFNSGNVGIGTTTPTSLLHLKNPSGNTSDLFSVENDGDGYNIYSYKTGTAEAVYLVKDNIGSGTPNIYATNNGSGNTMDVFATGTGYAGSFRGGATSPGGIYAKTTNSAYAGIFDGDVSGGAIKAVVSGAGYAGLFQGKVKVEYDSFGGSSPHLTLYEATSTDFARLNFQNSSGPNYWSIAGASSGTAATAKMNFIFSTTNDILTLTGDGNVGIMNSSPTARLHVIGGGAYANSIVKIENTNGSSVTPTVSITSSGSGELINANKTGIGYGINVQKTGSLSSSAAIYGGNAGGNGEGIRGSAFGTGGYGVYGNAAGNGAASFTGVYGYGSGSTSVDYGIYGQQGAGANDYAGFFSGNVGYTGTLLSTSDARLKQNIKDFNGGLNAVMQLKAKTYEYKHDGDLAKMNLPEGEQIGLIAQDIEKVLPDLIKDTQFNAIKKKDGEAQTDGTSIAYKGVNYIGMIPVLINAIQEQQAQIEDLKKQIDELKK